MEPRKIKLFFTAKRPILAMGSHTKNTICFVKDNYAYLSPVHQDLNDPKDFLRFQIDAKYFLGKKPGIIAYDLHPEYQSTKYALSLPATYYLLPVQHHHAHIASCMLENGLRNQRVIGVAFDGTGLGPDNRLWGAEFLICDYKDFKRRAHLREVPLLGAEKAILEPWRLAAVWLYLAYKEKFLDLDINFVKGINKKKWRVLEKMYLSGFNSPLASSAGRLFDAAASLILEKYKANFEAELAMELEKIALRYTLNAIRYKFKMIKNKDEYILDPLPMFKQIVADLKSKEPRAKIAYRFHLTLAQMIKESCLILRKENKINKVVLSGGVFQNNLLLCLSLDLLYQERFEVVTHKQLSCNDSCISLGQAVIAKFSRTSLVVSAGSCPGKKDDCGGKELRYVPSHSHEGKKN
jgi:hydrogenase maturation protein HypF